MKSRSYEWMNDDGLTFGATHNFTLASCEMKIAHS